MGAESGQGIIFAFTVQILSFVNQVNRQKPFYLATGTSNRVRMHEALKDIERQRSRWIQAINNSSADGFVDVISNDAVWLPPGEEAVSGKETIRNWVVEPFSELEYEYSVSDVKIRIAGDWAVEQARFTSTASTKSGERLPVHEGLYTLLWRKSKSAGWLIERYIDHSAEFVNVDTESDTGHVH